MRLSRIAFIAICLWAGWHWYHTRPVAHVTAGVWAESEPDQSGSQQAAFNMNGYQIQPLAHFKIKARVLSREDYSIGKEADLSPTDLALGWGRMSDVAVYSQLAISQGGRFYHWRYENQPPIPVDEIIRSSANMHLIPANSQIKSAISQVRQGQIIALEGELVEADDPGGWRWRSSLTRTDSGAGACEVIWVQSFAIESG